MAEYIELEKAVSVIEQKQKELCPVGRYGRSYVYGTDREKYDEWQEIIDELASVRAADVAPVVHGHWEGVFQDGACSWSGKCSVCMVRNDIPHPIVAHYCPNCGAKMDL